MPELPEVETVCWRLRQGGQGEEPLKGRRIVEALVDDAVVVRSGSLRDVVGAVVTDVERRAKWILIRTDRPLTLLCHLRMTGDLHVLKEPPPRFVRWRLRLDDSRQLVFTDPRRFGHVDVVADASGFFTDLGPEPLSPGFTPTVLRERLRGRRAIKAALLDQTVVAGLGNIYVDEALFIAGVDPRTAVDDVRDEQFPAIHAGIQQALTTSIAASRTELAWRYENRGTPSPFQVYERAGEPCLRCQTVLLSASIGGRTTVWCPQCQPSQKTTKTKTKTMTMTKTTKKAAKKKAAKKKAEKKKTTAKPKAGPR